jgi:hypothetical protein
MKKLEGMIEETVFTNQQLQNELSAIKLHDQVVASEHAATINKMELAITVRFFVVVVRINTNT